jgi:glucosamine--fructose-6-phosphate aminotransferase (isomerizing)
MCGIIGYIGEDNAVPILIEGLKRLEYRGYDSAGIAIINNAQLAIRKAVALGIRAGRPMVASPS